MPPHWLPGLLQTNGVPTTVYQSLFAIFQREIQAGGLTYGSLPIVWNTGIKSDGPGYGYPEGFWHLIERKNQRTGVREFDPRRAERLSWFAAVLNNATSPEVICFKYKEGDGKVNTYLWLKNDDYVIVLREQKRQYGQVMMIMSAYHIDGPSSQRQMAGKYERRITS